VARWLRLAANRMIEVPTAAWYPLSQVQGHFAELEKA
jgi:hypothetical protein